MQTQARHEEGTSRLRVVRRARVVVAAVAVLGAAALALALAGCGGGKSAAPAPGKLIRLNVGNLPIVDAAPMFVALDRGYFKEEGLDVEVRYMAGGATLAPAVESGALDLGMSNVVSMIQATVRGLPLRCFAGALRKPAHGENLVLIASPKTQVTSPADLSGKTIAVNTLANINQLVAEAWLKKHGVDPSSVNFRALEFPDMPAALESGQVDAAIEEQPFVTISLSQGAKIIDPRPYEAIARTPLFSCWFSTTKWIAGHKQAARAYVRALNKAIAYANAHPAWTKSIIPKYTKVPAEIAPKLALATYTTKISPSDLQPWIDAGVEFKILPKTIDGAEVIQRP